MTKSDQVKEEGIGVTDRPSLGLESQAQHQATQQVRLRMDEREISSCYANAFRTNATAEEVVLDFGLNMPSAPPQKDTPAEITFKITHRVILNYPSAKRLALTLGQLVRRYEDQFGQLELDASKRVRKNV